MAVTLYESVPGITQIRVGGLIQAFRLKMVSTNLKAVVLPNSKAKKQNHFASAGGVLETTVMIHDDTMIDDR